MKKGYLVLQDGQVFEGFRFGGPADAVGELVFTTGMCGYLETLTDPSYAGQIVMQTYPLIGNYGIIPEDFEGACCVRGYVVREWCEEPSNFRCQGDLDAFLRDRGVPGLWGVDTRELTRIIREHGVMNAAICDEVPADLTAVKTYAVTGVVEAVTAGLVSIWFVPGAVAGLIAAMAGAGLLIQLVLFLAVSAAALAATRPLVKKLSAGRAVPTNADRVLGRTARVTETIDNDSASGAVYVDGELLEEDYINEPTYVEEGTEFPLTVPEGSIFVMGDNRNGSSDSRDYRLGTVDTRYVIGKAAFLIFPGPDYETEKRDFKRIGVIWS